MNAGHDPLDRLFRAAARARHPEGAGHAAEMEARVMAAWRSNPAGDFSGLLVFWLRRAVAMACVVVLLSAAWSFRQGGETTVDAMSLADTAVQTALNHE